MLLIHYLYVFFSAGQIIPLNLRLTPDQLVLPLIAIGGTWGWRRGWQEEAWTGMLFLLSIVVYNKVQGKVLDILKLIVSALLGLFKSLLSPNGTEGPTSNTAINVSTDPNASIAIDQAALNVIVLLMIVVGVYLLGGALGKRKGLKTWGHLVGVVFGTLNASIILAWLLDAWFSWGSHPTQLLNKPVTLPAAHIPQVTIPQITIPAINLPGFLINSTIPSLPTHNSLANWGIYGAVIFFVILVVVGIFRLPKISE